MPMIYSGGNIGFVRLSMPLRDFGKYLQNGCNSDTTTPAVEQQAEELIACGFEISETEKFIKSVCAWGNYAGVSGRVFKHNTSDAIVAAVSNAYQATVQNNTRNAITCITALRGLGVSFGSKHLKFLAPKKYVVLDSIISGRLGYASTVDGYCEFVVDCKFILKHLKTAKIPTTVKGIPVWRLADVEMAVFQKLRE
jgi:hypothetical protein